MDDLHLTFHLSSLTVLVFHLFLTHVCKGQSELIGSSQPIVATLGEDVVLPCHLQPVKDATDLTLEWTRPDLDPRFVHVWRSQQELLGKKHNLFQGRTSLFIDELKKGNISLKLSKVKLSDEGHYRCFIPALEKETFVQLHVASAPVSSPIISLSGMDRDRGGVVLQCESAGWYPEPEVLWLDAEGNLLSAGPPETVRGPDDLYTVSSRVTVDKRHSNSFTCRVQQTNINQTREAHIHVPDDFFLSSSSSAVPINTGLAVSLAVSIMVILAGVFFVWRQNTTKTKKRSRDEAEKETEKMKLLEETKDLTEKYEKIEEELQKTKEELKNKTEEMRLQLKNKTEEMEKHVNELKEEKKKLEEELETRNKELEKIKDEVGRLTGDKTNLQQEIQRKEKILETRNKELKEIKDESSSSNKRMEDKLRRYKAAASISIWFLRFSSSKKKEEINQLKEEKKILEEELEKIINKLRRYKTAASISIWFLRLSRSKKVEEEVEKLTGDKMKLQEEKQQLKEIKDENSSSSDSQETSRDITVGVNQEYGCIFLRNMSDQDKPLGGRQLKVQINNEEPITYTFDQSVEVKAGKSVTLYRPDYAEHFGATADQVWSDLKSWMHGDRVQVTLQ